MSTIDKYRDIHEDFSGSSGFFDAKEPLALFEEWFNHASKSEKEPHAFALSTVNSEGRPSSRIVYLKDIIDGGFVFYTNYDSHKGKEIAENDWVSMLFFWADLSRQIRIEGHCKKVDESVSDAYFASRPRGSQIGAWASAQSDELSNREELVEKVQFFEEKFPNEVPRPPHWGGYIIDPVLVEFWQGQPSRLHDRLVFEKAGEIWTKKRKNP